MGKGYLKTAISNFVASIAGSLVMGKCLGVLSVQGGVQGDSLVAYLCGTLLGLGVLSKFRTAVTKKHSMISLVGSLASVCLLVLYTTQVLSGIWGWLFFAFLCVRFGSWFLARVLRSDSASIGQESLAFVEFSYLFGVISGFLVAGFLPEEGVLPLLLSFDFFAQIAAALLDWNLQFKESVGKALAERAFSIRLFLPALVILCALTIADQIVGFALANQAKVVEGKVALGTSILAAGYLGGAIASLVQSLGVHISLPFAIPGCFVAMVLSLVGWHVQSDFLLLSMILFAGINYEFVALQLLHQVGEAAHAVGKPGMVAFCFSVMGVTGTLSLLVMVHFRFELAVATVLILCTLAVLLSYGFLARFIPVKD